jgi:hypothetical protein
MSIASGLTCQEEDARRLLSHIAGEMQGKCQDCMTITHSSLKNGSLLHRIRSTVGGVDESRFSSERIRVW